MREVDPALFPNVVAALRRAGIDPERELVPVAPAAHYMMGGVATDLEGRSTLPGLYAVGECSCTGLHGANRLASNSLTECFVFGRRAALAASSELEPERVAAPDHNPAARPPQITHETREALWQLAGLERDRAGLELLAEDPYPLAQLIARSALARTESRGAHQRRDFPERDVRFDERHVTITRDAPPALARWL
jgi:L-aspartate oxidase